MYFQIIKNKEHKYFTIKESTFKTIFPKPSFCKTGHSSTIIFVTMEVDKYISFVYNQHNYQTTHPA